MEDKTISNKQRQNKNRHFKLPPEIIEQYQEMPIFKAISSKKIKPFDVIRLHNLARQLKKQHPNLSSETILQNQIELYLIIQAELKKYFKSDKSDDARKNMDDAIKAKYQELAQNPLINKIYETNFEKYAQKGGNKAWINFTATNLQQIMHNQFNFDETQHWDDFIASADSLTQILESTTKKKEKSSLQNVKKTSADITKAPAKPIITIDENLLDSIVKTNNETNSDVSPSQENSNEDTSNPKNNFCIIDIGTNAAKGDLFFRGRDKQFEALRNKNINIADEDSVVTAVTELFEEAAQKGIKSEYTYIVATEGLRASSNSESIMAKIKEKTGRNVHIISPEREAYFAILGGLNAIPERKNLPEYVLFVESGGGSTEISLVNTKKRGFPVISTVSLPLGSKRPLIDGDEEKTQKLVTEKITEFKTKIAKKGLDISSLGMVINSGTASRIMWLKNHTEGETYNAMRVTKNRYGLSLADFTDEVKTLVDDLNSDEQKVKDSFGLSDSYISGFKGHAHVLAYITKEISQQFPNEAKNCQVLTTAGGLKDGAIQKIAYLDERGKSPEEIEQEMFENTQANSPEPHIAQTDDDTSLPPKDNDNFSKSWGEFTDTVAKKLEGGKVTSKKYENSKFTAEIEHSKGNVSITATTDDHVSLGAKDTDGKPVAPDLKVFQALAQKALDEGSIINFGNIKTPEFKARLLIACLEKGVEIKGKPKLTDEFLNSIDPASAKRLRILQNKQNTQSQPTPTPTIQQPAQTPDPETSETTPQPVSQPKSDYEKSRNEREKSLEMHSKTRSLTPQEQHELEYIKFTKEHKQALEEAIARTGDNNDPRTAEHTIATGLKYEDYYYHSDNRTYHGWKLHLDIVPNRKDKTTEAVSDFLKKLNVEHKIYHGGENGKGMTIYVGSYDDTIKLAKEINSRFGKDIATPPIYTDQKASEIDFNEKVAGRFYMSVFGCQYPHSSIKGICPINLLLNSEEQDTSAFLAKLAKQANIVSNDCSRYFHRIKDFHDRYVITNLESYCAHKFYQKHLGEFYCGKDADKFEQQIFGGALPPKGSSDRAAWDNIASQYVKKVEEDCPNCLTPPELKNYKPIDFTQAPAIVRPQQPQRQP